MNNHLRSGVMCLGLSWVLATGLMAAQKPEPGTTAVTLQSKAEGEFFMISSIDASQHQLVLKRPTEVTQLVKVNDKTQYLDAEGGQQKLTDLRAGDTVYVVFQSSGASDPLAARIQEGPMTVERLHRNYVNF